MSSVFKKVPPFLVRPFWPYVQKKLKGPPFATVKLKLLNQIDLFGNQVSKKHDLFLVKNSISNKFL